MFIKEVGFLEGQFLFSQSKQFKKLSKSSDWLEKAGSLKKHFIFGRINRLLAYLHDQNKSGFFGRPAFIQPIRIIWKVFKKLALQKSHFCFDHVNWLYVA